LSVIFVITSNRQKFDFIQLFTIAEWDICICQLCSVSVLFDIPELLNIICFSRYGSLTLLNLV
jgi:hypothetical protein